ncbi:MAG: hypothetical protein JW940_21265 [Polyangiaceae bacterium]|nr:hypothetical protein [Polyangiaceae bacterium]
MVADLTLQQRNNQEKRVIWSVIALLVVDPREHAYYLRCQNKRADYANACWSVVNWDDVSKGFPKARTLDALR